MPHKAFRKAASVLGIAVVLASLAACTSDDGGTSPSADPSGSFDAAAQADRDARLRALACSDDADPDFPEVADVDLSKFTWTIPNGFVAAPSYSETDPVEGPYRGQFAVPSPQKDSKDVLGSVIYPQLALGPLVDKCDRLDAQAAKKRLAQYHEIQGTTVVEEAQQTTIGGLPAFREVLSIDGGTQSWQAYWVFGRNQLLQLACQWKGDQATIERGCEDLVNSFKFTG